MNVDALKVELMRELLNTNNQSLLKQIKAIFDARETDLWDEMPDEIKVQVERGLEQLDKGEYRTHDEVMKNYKKWLKK